MLDKLKACTALWGATLIVGTGLVIPTAPTSWADVCGDVGGRHVSVGGCTDPGAEDYAPPPPPEGAPPPDEALPPPDEAPPPPPPPAPDACADVGGRHVSVGGCT